MPKLRLSIAMSLDGFVAGPSQSVENPLGSASTETGDLTLVRH